MSKNKKQKKVTKKTGETKMSKMGKDIVRFPGKLLAPVGNYLQEKLKTLERRKEEITEEDPFKDTSRLMDNASPDADAAEQFGHARTSAIREQLDKKIIQTKKALTRIKVGKYGICEDCGEMIDTDRLIAYPESTLCADCKIKTE